MNGTATLKFADFDENWVYVIFYRAFVYNVVPNTLWLQSPGDTDQGKYVVLDSLAISVYETTSEILEDLNEDGLITQLDRFIFRNHFLADPSDLSFNEAYFLGDLDGDFDNDLDGFRIFKAKYIAANGADLFAAMLQSVPEPLSLMLVVLAVFGIYDLWNRSRIGSKQ